MNKVNNKKTGWIASEIKPRTQASKRKIRATRLSQMAPSALLTNISLASTGVDNNVSQVSDSFSAMMRPAVEIINESMKVICSKPAIPTINPLNWLRLILVVELIPYMESSSNAR